MVILFWASITLLIYTYLGYPIFLYIIGRFIKNNHTVDEEIYPKVTLLIPAYNEEKDIEAKIQNSLELDYPEERLEIIVSCDGCTDRTDEIAKEYIKAGIKCLSFKERAGKMAVLNKTVPIVKGDIIVFTDANAMLDIKAIKNIVRHFGDKKVGCVCGEKNILTNKGFGTEKSESLYWRLESFLKRWESYISSCSGADGSLYAIHKELYPFPKDNMLIMDDMIVSLKIVEKGYRCIYEPKAKAFESSSINTFDEFTRKVRILSGSLTAIWEVKRLLIPFISPIAFQLWSRKVLRWVGILFMISAFFSNLFLKGIFYKTILWIQGVFYLMAILGLVMEIKKKRVSIFYIPFYFCLANLAQIVGIWSFWKKKNQPAWKRLER